MPRPRAQRPAASSDVRVALDALRRIVQGLRAGGADGMSRAGLSSAQLFALQQIGEHPNLSINELAARTFTHQSSVSVVVQRLVRRRLVAKVTAEHDRRRQHLALTARGRGMVSRAPVAVQEQLIDAIDGLVPGDRRVLARALMEIARAVAPEGGAPHPPMFFEESAARRRKR